MSMSTRKAAKLIAVLFTLIVLCYLALPSVWQAAWKESGSAVPAQPLHPWLKPGKADTNSKDPCGELISTQRQQGEVKPVDKASVAVARKSCLHGDILVTVRVDQAFGYRYGDIVTAEVLIDAGSQYQFDFSTLERGFVRFDAASAFELADEHSVTISQASAGDERIRYRIVTRLRAFVETGKQVPLVIDLFFTDTKVRNRLSTPEVLISYSSTLDTAKDLIDNNTGEIAVPVPWLSLLCYLAALLSGLPLPVVLIFNWIAANRKLTAEENFWQAIDPVLTRASKRGFAALEAEAVLRQLGLLWHCPAATPQEMLSAQMRQSSADGAALASVIGSCEQILYLSGENLDHRQLQEFVTALRRIVPRPWTMKGPKPR